MRNFLIPILLLTVFFSIKPINAETAPFGKIVAVVNQEVITDFQLDQETRSYLTGQNNLNPTDDQIAEAQEKVLETLIDNLLLFQESKRRGILVSPEEIEAETNRRLEQIKAQFPSPQEFVRALAQQFTDEKRLKEQIQHQSEVALYTQRLVSEEVRRDITVLDEEVNEEYNRRGEKIVVSQIVLPSQSRAEEIRKQILDGADFAAMARRYSSAPSSVKGGELGAFGRGQLPPELDSVAFGLKVDEMSPVIQTELGYSLIKVTRRFQPELPPMTEETRNRIRNDLYYKKVDDGIDEFVKKLKETAYIELRGI